MLEKTIEAKFIKEANKRGCQCLKLNVMGRRSWPDRLVLIPGGRFVMIEFKRPGGVLSPGQEALHEDLLKMGHRVFVCYSAEEALKLL
jgi:hypothetical protein